MDNTGCYQYDKHYIYINNWESKIDFNYKEQKTNNKQTGLSSQLTWIDTRGFYIKILIKNIDKK